MPHSLVGVKTVVVVTSATVVVVASGTRTRPRRGRRRSRVRLRRGRAGSTVIEDGGGVDGRWRRGPRRRVELLSISCWITCSAADPVGHSRSTSGPGDRGIRVGGRLTGDAQHGPEAQFGGLAHEFESLLLVLDTGELHDDRRTLHGDVGLTDADGVDPPLDDVLGLHETLGGTSLVTSPSLVAWRTTETPPWRSRPRFGRLSNNKVPTTAAITTTTMMTSRCAAFRFIQSSRSSDARLVVGRRPPARSRSWRATPWSPG